MSEIAIIPRETEWQRAAQRTREQAIEALRLRREGLTTPEIAQRLGVSDVTAWRRLKLAYDDARIANVAEWRDSESAKLDGLEQRLNGIAAMFAENIEAIDRMIREHAGEHGILALLGERTKVLDAMRKALAALPPVYAQRAKLLGLNAPERVEHTIEAAPASPAVIGVLEELRARVSATEKHLRQKAT